MPGFAFDNTAACVETYAITWALEYHTLMLFLKGTIMK